MDLDSVNLDSREPKWDWYETAEITILQARLHVCSIQLAVWKPLRRNNRATSLALICHYLAHRCQLHTPHLSS